MVGDYSSCLCGWFEVLQAQVPEPVGDEAQAVESDLVALLHPIDIVVDPGDEAHLKHNEPVRKSSLSRVPTIGSIYFGNTNQRIWVLEIRRVACKTQGLYRFRYMVPYI